MARRRLDDIEYTEDDVFLPTDTADQAFWDEFWHQEYAHNDEAPLVKITITNEETGEEKVIENVRLRFKSMERLKE